MRVCMGAVLLCASAEAGFSHAKRHKSSSGSSAGDMLVSLAELLHIRTPPFVYNSDSVGSRQELIDALWAGNWVDSVAGRFSVANPALQLLLEKQCRVLFRNASRMRAPPARRMAEATRRG